MRQSRFPRWTTPILVSMAGTLLISGILAAAEFSANMQQKSPKKTYVGKLYVKGAKLRQELTQPRKEILILRPDQNAAWDIQPADKTYMRVSQRFIMGLDDPPVRAAMKRMGVMKKLGSEKISGYVCTKTQWAIKGPPKYILTEWNSDKLKIPIKTTFVEPRGSVLIEYSHIKEGGVPDSVFELPKGYKRVQTPTVPKNARPRRR